MFGRLGGSLAVMVSMRRVKRYHPTVGGEKSAWRLFRLVLLLVSSKKTGCMHSPLLSRMCSGRLLANRMKCNTGSLEELDAEVPL